MYYKFANLRIEFCWGLGGDGDHVGATGSVGLRPSGRRVDNGMVLGWTAGGRPSRLGCELGEKKASGMYFSDV